MVELVREEIELVHVQAGADLPGVIGLGPASYSSVWNQEMTQWIGISTSRLIIL